MAAKIEPGDELDIPQSTGAVPYEAPGTTEWYGATAKVVEPQKADRPVKKAAAKVTTKKAQGG